MYSNLHYMFYEDMIEVRLKWSSCWSLLDTSISELLLCFGVRFCRILIAKWTNSVTFWACPPPSRRRGKLYLMLSLTTWKRTTWSITPQSLPWTLKFLTSCGKVTWSWHRMFRTSDRTDSLCCCRKGWWLEEPFHCGTEWGVWWRLRKKNDRSHASVPCGIINPIDWIWMWIFRWF